MSSKIALPRPFQVTYRYVDLEPPGRWLILSDIHIPFHDRKTLQASVRVAKKRGVNGVILNGDIADQHELSKFDKSPNDPRYVTEVGMVRGFLRWLRQELPKPRILFKEGNHEERLYNYLFSKAPALFGLDVLTLSVLFGFRDLGIEHVSDRNVIRVGKLHVIHGHEYRPSISVPVNPARGLFLRTKSPSLCGHWHQTSEHHEPTISGKNLGSWSVGCACYLYPQYSPLNKWNHGFAIVDVYKDGDFSVDNFRLVNGRVV